MSDAIRDVGAKGAVRSTLTLIVFLSMHVVDTKNLVRHLFVQVDELACAYQWGKFPFRSPSKIESLLKDKPIFEVHRSIAADQHTSTSIDSIRILIPAAFLLSSIGIAIALVSSIMRSASRYGNDVKNPILPN